MLVYQRGNLLNSSGVPVPLSWRRSVAQGAKQWVNFHSWIRFGLLVDVSSIDKIHFYK